MGGGNRKGNGVGISTVVAENNHRAVFDAETEILDAEARLSLLDADLAAVLTSARNACEYRLRDRKLLQSTTRELDDAVLNEDYELAALLETRMKALVGIFRESAETDHSRMRSSRIRPRSGRSSRRSVRRL
jgi:hypothetical protein